MNPIKASAALWLILILVPSGPALAQAASAPATMDSLLAEVRLLRLAIERQTEVVSRSQVLTARLSTQEQRVVRARALQEAIETKIADVKVEEDQMTSAIERVEAALDDPARSSQHKEIEVELKAMQDRLKGLTRVVTDLQTRRSLAEQVSENERQRLDELEARLLREDFSGRPKR